MRPPPLSLLPPNLIRYQTDQSPVGPTVYMAIRAILAADGEMTVASLCRAVWGREDVKPATVWSLCHRLNAALATVRYPVRVGSEDGRMLLC